MTKTRLEGALMLTGVIIPFAATLFAIVLLWQRMVDWSDLALMFVMYCITGMGITIGFHRMLAHRSFEAHPVVRFLLLVAGSMALEGPPRIWAATHIRHHARSDREGDPHSPLEGFWHAHMGWFMYGIKTDFDVYGTWLQKDRMVMLVSRLFPLWAVLSLGIPYLIGGWTGFLWGGLVRVFLCHHVTWSINSVCHVWGGRPFQSHDMSRNNFLFGLFGFGEGWHNNHHAFPRSAFHGLRWWQVDISGYVIRALEVLGLARDVHRVPAESMEARRVGREETASDAASLPNLPLTPRRRAARTR